MADIIKLVDASDAQRTAVAQLMCQSWPEHYGPNGQGDAVRDVDERANGTRLPIGWVATLDGIVVGTVACAETSFGQSADTQGPWLIGLTVDTAVRNQGIASELVGAVMAYACNRGWKSLFTTTISAQKIMARHGWRDHSIVSDNSQDWTVMALDLTAQE